MYEKLTKDHLPYVYEIRFSVEENILLAHQIQYLLRKQAIEDIEQGGGWICKVGHDYAGFGFGIYANEPLIGGLFVKPEYQSRGIGSRILENITNWHFENGNNVVYLTTDPGSRAEAFYERRGWVKLGYDLTGLQVSMKKEQGDTLCENP